VLCFAVLRCVFVVVLGQQRTFFFPLGFHLPPFSRHFISLSLLFLCFSLFLTTPPTPTALGHEQTSMEDTKKAADAAMPQTEDEKIAARIIAHARGEESPFEKASDLELQTMWRYEWWLNAYELSRNTLLDYFRWSDFYDKKCNNEQVLLAKAANPAGVNHIQRLK
jgi:MED6 mediator sub complex component